MNMNEDNEPIYYIDPEWQKNNMEFDLCSTSWILEKVRASDNYAQNLYAAICNRSFKKISLSSTPNNTSWSASWRSAGDIIAEMKGEGDYLDWYCSGMGNNQAGYGLSSKVPVTDSDGRNYVREGTVTEEIDTDLRRLGWELVKETIYE
jgi:hypothetical protein